MTTQNLLVELFVEELPPKALKKLGDAFAGVLFEQLKAQGLASADVSVVTAYASPRRLAAHVTHVWRKAADKAVQQKLMPVSVGLDASGHATPALLKKLQALGADVSDPLAAVAALKRAPDGKAEALFYDSLVTGAALDTGLQKALEEAIAKLPIPKVMSYQLETDCALPGWSSVNFVRPAHGLVALHGSTVVPITALGLKAGNTTQGHRFEAKVSPVVIQDADAYAQTLLSDGAVIASFNDRRFAIVQQLAQAAERLGPGYEVLMDEDLLSEVTGLVEHPNVLVCEFEAQFLDVPQECLILTMKANQKYFPLVDAKGKLTNKFLVVSNISPDDASAVIGGNERVVRPRLADAKFFFDQDRKKTLASRVAGLDKVVYHNKLGSLGERMVRVGGIAYEIGMKLAAMEGDSTLAIHAQHAAQLAKADLVTDMVGEFPELQGTMGRYYATNDGVRQDIADAIEDHYKPRFAGDELPRNEVGVVIALADKLETLVGMFGIGNLPTGDKDPFALRRHALGVIRMLEEKVLPLSIFDLVQKASDRFPIGLFVGDKDGQRSSNQLEALRSFFFDRYAVILKERGHSPQEIEAVFVSGNAEAETLQNVAKRLAAVRAFAALPEAPALAAANKRIANILKKAGEVDAHVNPALLREDAEKGLYQAMQQLVPKANTQFEQGNYTGSLQTLAALRAPVDAFFDGVMVNAEEMDLRLNRQGLLKSLHDAMNRVADLSKLAS